MTTPPIKPADPFRAGRRALLVLAGNAVPVAGVYAFNWPADFTVLDYWFDGVSVLGALVAVTAARSAREDLPPGAGWRARLLHAGVGSLLGFAVLGIPYWFTLFILHQFVLSDDVWAALLDNRTALFGFLVVAASNLGSVLMRGYGSMPEPETRRWLFWEFNVLLLRVAMMLLVAFFIPRAVVAGTAIAMTLAEMYPLRMMRFLGAPLSDDDVPPGV